MNARKDSPVFIFSACWRTGSTLLQRLISSTGEVLVWGESGGALNCLSEALERYNQMIGAGDKKYLFGYGGNGEAQYNAFRSSEEKRDNLWIASMNAPGETIRRSFIDFFHKTYALPAQKIGYKRWGVKETQCGISTANFLAALFPNSKFLFLLRNPIDCLRSIKKRNWMDMNTSPDPLKYYAKHWGKAATEFIHAPYGMKLKYEELVSDPSKIKALCDYIEIPDVPFDFISANRADWKPINHDELTRFEKWRIKRMLYDKMDNWGYKV